MSYPKNTNTISSIESLRGINGAPAEQVKAKIQCCLDPHSIDFLQRSPFMVLASSSGNGADVSPRGCDKGFARVIDDTTVLLPEQPGNKLADSMTNIFLHRAIGMLFMIPGMNETLRINGDAFVTDVKDYLSCY